MATATPTSPADAKIVEGSDGLLLEVDGRIVPNYDAVVAPFEEGDVVSGKVVRIDSEGGRGAAGDEQGVCAREGHRQLRLPRGCPPPPICSFVRGAAGPEREQLP